MTKSMGWRRLLTCATIDALLIVAARAALAAPAATNLPEAAPVLPPLLVLGVGLVVFGLQRHARG